MRIEDELLLACARLDLDAPSRSRIEELLRNAAIDWPALLASADRHGLRPLLHRHLGAVAPVRVPKPVLVDLWAGYERGARRNYAMAGELIRVLDALEAEDIPALPYKGPALGCAVYGDLGLREFSDLDILLPARDVTRAKAKLESMGYASDFRISAAAEEAALNSGAHYHVLLRATGGRIVELHWRTDANFPVERDDAEWWRSLGRRPFMGVAVRAFPLPEMFLVLCLHGSKHRWGALAWLVDIAEMLRANAVSDAAAVAARARAMGAERRLYLGLRLARDLLEAPIPGPLQAGCERGDVRALAAEVTRDIFDPRAAGAFARLRRDLALYDRRSHQLRHAIQVIAAPSLVEWSRWKLPRALFFLYPAIRLARLTGRYLTRSQRNPPAATPRTPLPQPHSTG